MKQKINKPANFYKFNIQYIDKYSLNHPKYSKFFHLDIHYIFIKLLTKSFVNFADCFSKSIIFAICLTKK